MPKYNSLYKSEYSRIENAVKVQKGSGYKFVSENKSTNINIFKYSSETRNVNEVIRREEQ